MKILLNLFPAVKPQEIIAFIEEAKKTANNFQEDHSRFLKVADGVVCPPEVTVSNSSCCHSVIAFQCTCNASSILAANAQLVSSVTTFKYYPSFSK